MKTQTAFFALLLVLLFFPVYVQGQTETEKDTAIKTESEVQTQTIGNNEETLTATYNNPVKSLDDLTLTLTEMADVEISIETSEGRFMKMLMKQELVAGEHQITMLLSDLPNGDYKINIHTPDSKLQGDMEVHNPEYKVITSSSAVAKPVSDRKMRKNKDSEISTEATIVQSSKILTMEMDEKKIELSFDNPVHSGDILKLTVEQLTDIELQLKTKEEDRFIKMMMKQELMPGEHEIPLVVSDIPQGDYVLKLISGEHEQATDFNIRHQPAATFDYAESAKEVAVPAKEVNKTFTNLQIPNILTKGSEIGLGIKQITNVNMVLLDEEGRFIKLLMNQELMPGDHAIPVVVSDLPSGNYTLLIDTGIMKEEKKVEIKH